MGILVARAAAAVLTIAIVAPLGANASDIADVQGAWAITDFNCSDVFVTNNGILALKKRNDDTLPGFIIDGRRVSGIAAACNVAAIKPHPDGMSVLLSCTSQMSVGNLKLTVKMPNANTLIQSDPEFPELTTSYHRCR
jgi:hypothetical protein